MSTKPITNRNDLSDQAPHSTEAQVFGIIRSGKALLQKNPKEVERRIEEALELIKKHSLDQCLLEALMVRSAAHWQVGKLSESITDAHKARKLAKKEKARDQQCQAYLNLGIAYYLGADYKMAMKFYFKCLKLHNKFGPFKNIGSVFINMGTVYHKLEDTKKAIQCYRRALKLGRQNKNKNVITFCLNNIGSAYAERNQIKKALKFYEKAAEISEEAGLIPAKMMAKGNIAEMKFRTGDYVLAESLLEEVVDFYSESEIPEYHMPSLLLMARLKIHQKKLTEALALVNKSYELARMQENAEGKRDCYELFAEIYGALSDFKNADRYQEKFREIDEAISAKHKDIQMDLINMKSAIAVLELKNRIRKQKNNELKSVNEELEKFAYIASHDLKEPLRMIRSYAQLLNMKKEEQLDPKTSKYLEQIMNGVNRMEQLLNGLLDYARTSNSNMHFEEVDLNLALNDAIENLSGLIHETNTKINKSILPTVSAIPVQMVQLFQNIINNGIKFNRSIVPTITIHVSKEAESYTLSIRDNGIGISNSDRDTVFELMGRLHNRSEFEGTGIGLTTCKKIVERHNGKIWLESEEGKGTTFFIRLPATTN